MLEDRTADGKHVRYGALYGHVVNLMIAGHETTAATLGFTLQLLAENPEYEARALEERRIVVVTRALHTNPEYWGGEFGDPLRFNPDRFSPEAVQNRHPNAYHPWGFSTRACIGSHRRDNLLIVKGKGQRVRGRVGSLRTFLASMLIHFRLQGIPGYKLVASTEAGGAAPSPDNLAFQVFPRPGGPLWSDKGLMQPLPAFSAPEVVKAAQPAEKSEMNGATRAKTGPVMKVLYGSNSGSSQDFASQVEAAAGRSGFHCLRYNGMPPDNAGKFKKWLQTQKPDSLQGLKYAVFGVGNSQWHTYQQFPREVDAALNSLGGTRLCDLGACDVDGASFTSDFEDWLSNLLQTIGAAESTDHDEGLTGIDEFVVATHADGVKIMKEPGIVLAAIKEGKEAAAKALGLTEKLGFDDCD
eukprot:g2521.t1